MEYKNMKANRVIGKNLCNLRNMMGLKQEAFANELNKMLKLEFKINANYDHKTISNWEMGKSIPKMEVLIAISKKYNLSLDELLKDEIKDIMSKSNFSATEDSSFDNFLNNKYVCVMKNGKYESAFNPELYKYGQLSYLADNLVSYESEYSKNFSVTNPKKYVEVVVGIMDVNNGKRELHYLGNGENDIVSIENIPANYYTLCDVKNNNVIDSIMYNEILHYGFKQVIKLGNGKCYYIDNEYSHYNSEDYKFFEGNIPNDLDYYEINKDEYDWTDYAAVKGHYVLDDINLFDHFCTGVYYHQKAGVFTIVLDGEIKCTDAQLVKVLTDDYKHRLLRVLSKISDDTTCERCDKEIENYIKN